MPGVVVMARQSSAWLAASAQRFWTRRITHALVYRDASHDHDDPLRRHNRALAAGCVLAAIVVAICAVLAILGPRGASDTVAIVVARESGAMFVRIGDTLHPVPNLASARLVARTAAVPVVVADSTLASARRGPAVGIPGAPASIGPMLGATPWSVCDTDRTVVVAGEPAPLDAQRTVLAVPRGEATATTYLLYDGVRARVDRRDRAVARALRLDGVAPVPLSRALLDTVPEVPDVATPAITAAGAPGPAAVGLPVGTVVRVDRTDADEPEEFLVVLADGLQHVGAVAAEVIRIAYRAAADVPTIPPAAAAAAVSKHTLPVAAFPRSARLPVGAADGAAVCVTWHPPQADGSARTEVRVGDPGVPNRLDSVPLAQGDGEGPRVDAVALPPGRTGYARSVGVTGPLTQDGPRFLVADSGAVYGVPDDEAAAALGLTGPAIPAPWSVLAHLPAGPVLDVAAASVQRDVAAP